MKKRTELQKLGNQERLTFCATFERLGLKKYKRKFSPTILLKKVKCNGDDITDHVWLAYGKHFTQLGKLEKGDIIQFEGKIKSYKKGYMHTDFDYKIANPTKVKLLTDPKDRKQLPISNDALVGMIIEENMDRYYHTEFQADSDDYDLFRQDLAKDIQFEKDHCLSEWGMWRGNYWD